MLFQLSQRISRLEDPVVQSSLNRSAIGMTRCGAGSPGFGKERYRPRKQNLARPQNFQLIAQFRLSTFARKFRRAEFAGRQVDISQPNSPLRLAGNGAPIRCGLSGVFRKTGAERCWRRAPLEESRDGLVEEHTDPILARMGFGVTTFADSSRFFTKVPRRIPVSYRRTQSPKHEIGGATAQYEHRPTS